MLVGVGRLHMCILFCWGSAALGERGRPAGELSYSLERRRAGAGGGRGRDPGTRHSDALGERGRMVGRVVVPVEASLG